MENSYLVCAVFLTATVTALLRFLPFLLFDKGGKTPPALAYLGRVLPGAIIGMLVVYCMKDLSFGQIGSWLPALLAGGAAAGSYAWKRNTLMSIVLSTVLYMVLIRVI